MADANYSINIDAQSSIKQIEQLDSQIKTLNKSMQATASVSKSVEGASKTISTGFASMGGSLEMVSKSLPGLGVNVGGLTGLINVLRGSLLKLLANPVVAIVAAVVVAVKSLIDAIRSSEDRVNELKTAFAAFNPIIDLVKQSLDFMAKQIVGVVVSAVDKLTSAIKTAAGWLDTIGKAFGADWDLSGTFEKATEAAQTLAAAESQYIKDKREWMVESAQIDQDVADLRAKVAQKDKYTNEERLAFLDQAIALELKKAKREKELAEQNLANLEAEAARSENDAAMNLKLAEAKVAVINADTRLAEDTRRLNAERANLIQTINSEAEAAQKAAEDEIKAIEAAEAAEELAIRLRQENLEKNEREQIDKILKQLDETRARAADEEEFELNKLAEKYDKQFQLFEKYGADTTALTEEYERQKTDISEKYAKQREKASEETAKLEKESIKQTISNATTMASALGDALGAISGLIDTSTEEGFEQAKKLQIALATINMLTGIATALTGAYTSHTGPWDWILAGIQATTIAATSIANINKIKSTTFENANPSSATSNVSSASLNATLVTPTDYSQAVQGASIEEKVGDTRVYVTEGDIRSTNRKVTVAESESRY